MGSSHKDSVREVTVEEALQQDKNSLKSYGEQSHKDSVREVTVEEALQQDKNSLKSYWEQSHKDSFREVTVEEQVCMKTNHRAMRECVERTALDLLRALVERVVTK